MYNVSDLTSSLNVVYAYLQLNLKMLVKEKLSFVWSICLPSVFLLSNKDAILDMKGVGSYQIYIIFTAYIYGVVLYSINIKESGCLKVFFSIKNCKFQFFFANLLTQMVFSAVCVCILNILASVVLGFSFLAMSVQGLILIICGIPIAFLFFGITLLDKIRYQVANTIFTIVITVCLILLGYETSANYFNPLYIYMKILYIDSYADIFIYFGVIVVSMFIGVYSIKKYSVLSNEVR